MCVTIVGCQNSDPVGTLAHGSLVQREEEFHVGKNKSSLLGNRNLLR